MGRRAGGELQIQLLTVRDHLLGLNLEVVLREPLEEEVVEMREFVFRGV